MLLLTTLAFLLTFAAGAAAAWFFFGLAAGPNQAPQPKCETGATAEHTTPRDRAAPDARGAKGEAVEEKRAQTPDEGAHAAETTGSAAEPGVQPSEPPVATMPDAAAATAAAASSCSSSSAADNATPPAAAVQKSASELLAEEGNEPPAADSTESDDEHTLEDLLPAAGGCGGGSFEPPMPSAVDAGITAVLLLGSAQDAVNGPQAAVDAGITAEEEDPFAGITAEEEDPWDLFARKVGPDGLLHPDPSVSTPALLFIVSQVLSTKLFVRSIWRAACAFFPMT
jgi:hypothetical protein